MPRQRPPAEKAPTRESITRGKSTYAISLLHHFIDEFKKIGSVQVKPTKTMIGITTDRKAIAYVTQLGKKFIHVVFMFKQAYPDNLCFEKIAQVPGQQQFNHHCRILFPDDVNSEVRRFMKLAYELGK